MPRMISPTIAPANSGTGWSNGMAAQVSLPNMLLFRPRGNARIGPASLRARPRRQYLCGNLLEQFRRNRAIGERCYVHALPGEDGIARAIKGRTGGGTRGVDPCGELLWRHGVQRK